MKLDGYIRIAVALVVLPLLAACRQELCYNHFPSVDISLDWEQEWERDYGMAHADNWDADYYGFEYSSKKPDLPEWVSLVKFYKDGSSKEEFLETKGGNLGIDNKTEESYLLYNGDTEYIVIHDIASLTDARATTSSRSRSTLQYLQALAPNTRMVSPPDNLFAAYVEELPQVNMHEKKPMPVKMQPLVYTYIIRYEFEEGLDNVAIARGAISGMAESVYLRNGVTSDETAILLYDCEITDYGCEAHVKSFGVPSFPDEYYGNARRAQATVPVAVNLELRLTKGSTIEFNFDVSDQMANQPRGGVIKIKGIRVTEEDNKDNAGAFDVSLSDWGPTQDIILPITGQ